MPPNTKKIFFDNHLTGILLMNDGKIYKMCPGKDGCDLIPLEINVFDERQYENKIKNIIHFVSSDTNLQLEMGSVINHVEKKNYNKSSAVIVLYKNKRLYAFTKTMKLLIDECCYGIYKYGYYFDVWMTYIDNAHKITSLTIFNNKIGKTNYYYPIKTNNISLNFDDNNSLNIDEYHDIIVKKNLNNIYITENGEAYRLISGTEYFQWRFYLIKIKINFYVRDVVSKIDIHSQSTFLIDNAGNSYEIDCFTGEVNFYQDAATFNYEFKKFYLIICMNMYPSNNYLFLIIIIENKYIDTYIICILNHTIKTYFYFIFM